LVSVPPCNNEGQNIIRVSEREGKARKNETSIKKEVQRERGEKRSEEKIREKRRGEEKRSEEKRREHQT